jgi:hypothetical protein
MREEFRDALNDECLCFSEIYVEECPKPGPDPDLNPSVRYRDEPFFFPLSGRDLPPESAITPC